MGSDCTVYVTIDSCCMICIIYVLFLEGVLYLLSVIQWVSNSIPSLSTIVVQHYLSFIYFDPRSNVRLRRVRSCFHDFCSEVIFILLLLLFLIDNTFGDTPNFHSVTNIWPVFPMEKKDTQHFGTTAFSSTLLNFNRAFRISSAIQL